MVNTRGTISGLAMTAVVGAMLTACSGGANESEFVAACLTEGQSAASKGLDKELGVAREAFCKCGATVAKSSLSTDGYRAMVLEMQGKREEASSITSKMNESEQLAAVKVAADMVAKCAPGAKQE